MQKQTKKPPTKLKRKTQTVKKKDNQPFPFKRLIMGEEKPDLTELEAGSTTVGSCWLAPLVEAGEGVNLIFIFKRQPKEKILSKIAQTTMVNRSRMRDVW